MVGEESTYLTHESGDVNKFLIMLSSSLLVIKKSLVTLQWTLIQGGVVLLLITLCHLETKISSGWVGQYAGVQTLLLPYLTISSN